MKTMKRHFISFIYIACLICITACNREDWDGEGFLTLSIELSAAQDAPTVTRTLPTVEELNNSCAIKIRNAARELIREYYGLNNVPTELQLVTGAYSVSATAGNKVDVAFDAPYYEGETNFNIEKGTVTTITLPVYLQNTLVEMAYSDAADKKFKSCVVNVSMSKGSLDFDKSASQTGYFIMPEGETELDWSLNAVTVDGIPYQKTGVIKDIKSSTKYTLHFDYQELEPEDGGMYLQIQVEEEPVDPRECIFQIGRAPVIERYENDQYYSLNDPLNFSLNDEGRDVAISIRTSSELKSLTMSCLEFQSLLGLSFTSFDIHTLADNVRVPLEEKGISYFNEYNVEKDVSTARITLSDIFFKYFTQTDEEKTYYIDLKAIDNNKRYRTAQVQIMVSNAIVTTQIVKDYNVWSSHAFVTANVNTALYDALEESQKVLSFNYRKKGETEWFTQTATLEGSTMSTTLNELESGITYEFTATCAGQASPAATYEFTTETAAQLPNSSFEDWQKPNDAWLIYPNGGNMFWDSGNHGSATLKVNVTNYDETIKAPGSSGNRSIKMESQFVSLLGIGKFAAGNVFAGQYIGTDGTDGILGFGRTFTSRPAKLKGYMKYISTAITDRADNAPDDAPAIGAADQAHIYVAVGDWENETGIEPPVIIKTKETKLFDKTGPGVIAYGELVQSTSTEGTEMIPFEITLDYRDLTRKPLYIIVVASASKYGDYFTGGRGSTLWLDDLELVYE